MTNKCGNCKHRRFITNMQCQNPIHGTTMKGLDIVKKSNDPNYCCEHHELKDDIRANLAQYPARFLENV